MLSLKDQEQFPSESEVIEYKAEFNEKCKREIAALLNGGQTAYIYLGIDDNRRLNRLFSNMERHKVEEQLSHWLSSGIYYPSPIGLVKAKLENDIFCIEVNPGPSKPYFLDGRAYVRNGSESVKASSEKLTKMIFSQKLDTFDISESPVQELNFDTIKDIFKKQKLDYKPKALGFFSKDNKYTNAAFLFSDQNTFSVKVAIFDGKTVDRFKDRREFVGSLPKQIDEVLTYVNLNNALSAEITGKGQRDEKRSYPKVAIREAFVNAIVHRSYFSRSPIQIEIFDDRLTIMSPGPLPGGMMLKSVLNGQTFPRNPQIVKTLHKLKYIEDYGTGIRRILSSYEEEEVHPNFDAQEDFVKVAFPNLNYKEKTSEVEVIKPDISGLGEDSLGIPDNWRQVIAYLGTHPYITRPVVELLLDTKDSQANKNLKDMVDSKILKKIGSGPATRYVLINNLSS